MNPIDFLSNIGLSKDFARPNRFAIEIFPPQKLSIDNTTLKSICANIKNSSIPGKSLDLFSHNSGGFSSREIPFTINYDPVPVTFYLSSDLKEKIFFEEWKKLVINEVTGTLGYYDDYVGTMIISQLDRKGNKTKEYQLLEAYPSVINEVITGNEIENAISEVVISMKFRKYI